MKIKDTILTYFKEQSADFVADRVTIAKALEVGQDDYQMLFKTLNMLEKENVLIRDHSGAYGYQEPADLFEGILRMNKRGFGFVVQAAEDEEDLFVSKDDVGIALDGDTVSFRKVKDEMHADKIAAKIVGVVKRSNKEQVGLVEKFNKNFYRIKPDNAALFAEILCKRSDYPAVMPGHKVLFTSKEITSNNKMNATIVDILGHVNDPGIDILSIVKQHGIPTVFQTLVMDEVAKVPNEVPKSDLEGRVDLTAETIVTIDGADAKDLDDAISIEKLVDGNFKLGVHIADVSHYVPLGQPIDNEAYFRGTSVYLADRVIPMLPHQLSNGICSLNEDVIRLTLSCEMVLSPAGDVISRKVFTSYIKTTARMTYTDVNAILEDADEALAEKYQALVPMFHTMLELAKILEERRTERGSLDFAIDEAKIIVDAEGKAIDIQIRERGISEKIIEQFMIEANEAVATIFTENEWPFIYRIHAIPKDAKLDAFKQVAAGMGIKVGQIKNVASLKPKVLQEILAEIEKSDDHTLLASLLLKAMNKAEYSAKNVGHFGLASINYTHFTSPIRRYPDLTVHRLIKHFALEQTDGWKTETIPAELVTIAQETSITERRAIACERDVAAMKMAEFMEKHVGETFKAVISGVTATSMFVELPNLIEGRISVESMVDDFYVYIPERLTMQGRRGGKQFTMGNKITVTLVYASKEESSIIFEITDMKQNHFDRRGPSRGPRPDGDRRPSENRGGYNNDRRPSGDSRDNRSGFNNDRRPSRGPRPDGDRRPSENRGGYNNDRRPSGDSRDNRSGFSNDRRPSRGPRPDGDRRPSENRGGYNNDRRPGGDSRDNRSGFSNDRRPSRGPRPDGDRRPSENRGGYNNDRRSGGNSRDNRNGYDANRTRNKKED